MPICRLLLRQLMRWAFTLARLSAGKSRAAKMAMMAMTTNSSMRVKAGAGRGGRARGRFMRWQWTWVVPGFSFGEYHNGWGSANGHLTEGNEGNEGV